MIRYVFVLLTLLGALPLAAAGKHRFVIVMHESGPSAAYARPSLLRDGEERQLRSFRTIAAFGADLTDDEAALLSQSPGVRSVRPVVERHIASDGVAVPASSYAQHQEIPYGVEMIHARAVWPFSRGAGVNVAVVDTGIDETHPDLVRAFAGGYNTFTRDGNAHDDNKHGTHVAGIIAAADNGVGVVGVAPAARIWAVKVLDSSGHGDDEHIAAGIDWVLAKKRELGGNWIVNLSLASELYSEIERAIVQKAIAENVLVIAAAGNRGMTGIDLPAGFPGVVGVGAIDAEEKLAAFSNSGPPMALVAPGVRVLSTVPVGREYVADVTTRDGAVIEGLPLRGTRVSDVEGELLFCGLGKPEEFPAAVKGKIALIRRGDLTFNEKVRNAVAAGARAVIIFNRESGPDDMSIWTLILRECTSTGCFDSPDDLAFDWPLAIGISYADGLKLSSQVGSTNIVASYRSEDYIRFNGTSMATPHVTGAAALAWALAPAAAASQIRDALEWTAKDLGNPGYDPTFGNGLVDALAAARWIAPGSFGGTPPPPPPAAPHRRPSSGH
jgi:subtilisin family serine protease